MVKDATVRDEVILDRYRVIGSAGAGGFGTVVVAWDPRIQRKVAIKTIELSETDALRAALPGADAVSAPQDRAAGRAGNGAAADAGASVEADGARESARWHGVEPWGEYLASLDDDSRSEHGTASAAGEGDVPGAPDASRVDDVSRAVFPASGTHSPSMTGEEPLPRTPGDCAIDGVGVIETPPARASAGASSPAGAFEADQAAFFQAPAHLPGLDEARTAALLSDPRIVTVFDLEVRGCTAYLIMEYVEGITLTRLLADYDDVLTIDMVTAVFSTVAEALEVAHAHNVLHLDIKPDNILINVKGQVKVTDFGLSTLADASGRALCGGGTIGYMPLEQMRRRELDARTDEWSLAAVLYEMLVGRNPFRARDLEEAEAVIEGAELVLPSLGWSDLDSAIDDAIFYALDPDPGERYASVRDFAEEAERFLGDPARGARQLAVVVDDALAAAEEHADQGVAAGEDAEIRPRRLASFLGFFTSALPNADEGDAPQDDTGYSDAERVRRGGGTAQSRSVEKVQGVASRTSPLGSARARMAIAHVWAALTAGFIGYVASSNICAGPSMPSVIAAVPSATILLVCAAACALVAATMPHLGMLIALGALSASLIVAGAPVVGACMGVATAAWWYGAARASVADANVGLTLVASASVGCGVTAPFAAGLALKPARAALASLYTLLWALVLAASGPGGPVEWGLPLVWDFASVNVQAALAASLGYPSTWCVAAGWIAAGGVFSACRLQGSRALGFVGVILAAALMVAAVVAGAWLDAGRAAFDVPWEAIAPVLAAAIAAAFASSRIGPIAR